MKIPDKPITMLNTRLVVKQKLNEEEVDAILLSHKLKDVIFEMSRNSTSKIEQKFLANMFEALEYEQQLLWKFPLDASFHRFFDFPGCTCPKMDNEERAGYPEKIYSSNCPAHWIEK